MDIKILLVIIVLCSISETKRRPSLLSKRPLYLRVHSHELCYDQKDVKILNFTILQDGPRVIVSGVGYLSRDIERIEKVIVTIRQCKNPTEDINCEHFQTWRFGREMCFLAKQKNMIWSPVQDSVQPPLKCPLRKGQYRMTNFTLDSTIIEKVFTTVPLEKYFWRVRYEMFDYERLFCGKFSADFLR